MYEQYEQSFSQRQAQVRHAVETASGVLAWSEQQEVERHLVAVPRPRRWHQQPLPEMRYGYGEYSAGSIT